MERPATSSARGAKPSSRVTIHSVAKHAQVAISTVSRVVNGGKASAGVTRRVEKAIAELGYRPSIMAQSLVARKAGCIGLVVNSCESAWFTQILTGVEQGLASSNNSVVLGSLTQSGVYDAGVVINWLRDRRVDGILLVRGSERDDAIIRTAEEVELPVVQLAPDLDRSTSVAVRCNNLDGGRLAAAHLLQLGHTRFGFAGGPQASVDSRMRLVGVQEALQAAGLTLPPEHIHFGDSYGHETGAVHAQRFLALPPEQRPTAVVFGNDALALSFMRSLLAAGLQVPRDVSVVGFDGTPEGERFWPSLTTVQQPTKKMAEYACSQLLQLIHTPVDPAQPDNAPTSTEFGVELLPRESTGAPPARP